MKLETSVDTQVKKELYKLEDDTKEITQNAIEREREQKKKKTTEDRFFLKKMQHMANWNSSRRERYQNIGNI